MYYATLIKGASYYVFGQRFLLNKECKITKQEYQYLRKNDWFQVRKEDAIPLFSQDIEKQERIP
ncbi:YqbF domain-containing protein [Bacillus cereus group sp. N6]|uniref:YqbF domain-containing protein n=1 Tax=Bacillus cereus group sp. N6 TaxID=2794583 RepID=UPI0018F51814|nr:YqbF domain-containing protein [Bacillus cereus group sp. N6]MBJ8113756.1 YqbF domain-containing protein [Bacillus cereus group sp. N6]